jgi:chromosome segregation ATPase
VLQISAKVISVLSSPRLKRVDVVEAIQGLQSALLEAERRAGKSKNELRDELMKSNDELRDELMKSNDELRDELMKSKDELMKCMDELMRCKDELMEASKEADSLVRALQAANMDYLILARTVHPRGALGTYGTYVILFFKILL